MWDYEQMSGFITFLLASSNEDVERMYGSVDDRKELLEGNEGTYRREVLKRKYKYGKV